VITLIPALAILAVGVNPTWALVLSQVVLSFGLPFALVPLVLLSGGRLLGKYANTRVVSVVAWGAVAVVVALNVLLVWLTIKG